MCFSFFALLALAIPQQEATNARHFDWKRIAVNICGLSSFGESMINAAAWMLSTFHVCGIVYFRSSGLFCHFIVRCSHYRGSHKDNSFFSLREFDYHGPVLGLMNQLSPECFQLQCGNQLYNVSFRLLFTILKTALHFKPIHLLHFDRFRFVRIISIRFNFTWFYKAPASTSRRTSPLLLFIVFPFVSRNVNTFVPRRFEFMWN